MAASRLLVPLNDRCLLVCLCMLRRVCGGWVLSVHHSVAPWGADGAGSTLGDRGVGARAQLGLTLTDRIEQIVCGD